ncbi:TRAP transporter small permease [Alkalibacillus haloalkaliphilus]|uniref:TRAP transporter small permease n=1 Tax=Alkalibacillus haloalkaliphilus TaxID=94136 RepID=UPI002936C45C|nr:TRAP transporter small permease [Alkalibacillus haloalkaliphilus]MDV2582174.1 TRAP transporter small permease [Alkalibacillus haloalkaliphilus]
MLNKITKLFVKLLSALCIISIVGLTVIVFAQVISRMISFSLPGTEELARLLTVWLTFFGASLAIHEKLHLSVNYFVSLVKENVRIVIGLIVHALMLVFFAVLLFYGFKLTIHSMGTTSSTLQLPMGLYYMVIPISSIFSIYFIFVKMLDFFRKGETTV